VKWDDDLELQGAPVSLQQNFCSEANLPRYHRNGEVDSNSLQEGRFREAARKTQQLITGMADPVCLGSEEHRTVFEENMWRTMHPEKQKQ
jgi:hypothetical protein